MKQILLFVLVLIFTNKLLPQDAGNQLIVSPLIGEKLDPSERMFYKLFPRFMGFVEARFFLNPDSSINANVTYKKESVTKDSLIVNYYKLDEFRDHLMDLLIQKINSANTEYKVVKLLLSDFSELYVTIYSVDHTSVKIFNKYKREVIQFDNNQIRMAEVEEGASLLPYALGGCLLGGMTGGVIGVATTSDEPGNFGAVFTWFGEMAKALTGILIGGFAGLFMGAIVGSSTTDINNYTTDFDGCFCKLNEYAIIPNPDL